MQRIESFEEVKLYLKHKEVITSNGSDTFYLKGDYVTHKFNGSVVRIKYEEFIELYKDSVFYIREEEQETVDLKKDEEYYGRIQKSN